MTRLPILNECGDGRDRNCSDARGDARDFEMPCAGPTIPAADPLTPQLSRPLIKAALRQRVQQRLRRWLACKTTLAPVLAPAVRPPQQKAADAAIQERLQPVLDELLSPHSSAEGFYNRRAGPHRNASIDETRLDTEFVEPAKIRRVIGAYAPLATEPDVVPCLRALALAGFPLALPVCEPESRIMSWVVWDGGLEALQGQSPFNLRTSTDGSGLAEAPREPDILVVPLVAFDHQLQRLGRGGGFYDATISDLQTRKRIVTIGLAYEAQALTAESHHEEGEFAPKVGATGVHASSAAGSHQHWWEDHDMALDIIVTECNILRHEKEP